MEAFSGHVEAELAYLIAAHALDEDSETPFSAENLKELASSCCGPNHACPADLTYLPSLLAHLPKDHRKHYCTRRITELLTVLTSLREAALKDLQHAEQALSSKPGHAETHETSGKLVRSAITSLTGEYRKAPPVPAQDKSPATHSHHDNHHRSHHHHHDEHHRHHEHHHGTEQHHSHNDRTDHHSHPRSEHENRDAASHTTLECAPSGPPSFPPELPAPRQFKFETWSGEISGLTFWRVKPTSEEQVRIAANWAAKHGWLMRPMGVAHCWSPLVVGKGDAGGSILLVDTSALQEVRVHAGEQTVEAQCGATLEQILTELEKNKLGLVNTPAPGVLTIAGMLAIGAHGTAIPALHEAVPRGGSFGSICNLVLSLRALVWNGTEFVVKTFARSDPEAGAFLAHIGRATVLGVTLQAAHNSLLRCVSTFDTHADELFAPTKGPNSYAAALDKAGRAEAIWFPFTDKPWLKVWSVLDAPPSHGRHVTHPYNYPLSDHLPLAIERFVAKLFTHPHLTKMFGKLGWLVAAASPRDIWGDSKNLLLYIRPNTLRVSVGGGAVLTTRDNIQKVIHDWITEFIRLRDHVFVGHPLNSPVEIRCVGLDQPAEVITPNPSAPHLCPLNRHPDKKWDVVLYINASCIPKTEGMHAYMAAIEKFMSTRFNGGDALYRPEWAKGWAWTDSAPWENKDLIKHYLPQAYPGWNEALQVLNRYDPKRVFSNHFIDQLLP